MNVLGLLQLVDSAHAGGDCSYGVGIRKLVTGGHLRCGEQVPALVENQLGAVIGPSEGVAAGVAFRAARRGQMRLMSEVSRTLSSERLPEPMRLASLQMGTYLWELSRRWEWAAAVHEQMDPLAGTGGLHHAVAFGALVSETTSQQVRAIATYLFRAAKVMVSAAVEAMPLEEALGRRLLANVLERVSELAPRFVDREPDEIAAVQPMLFLSPAGRPSRPPGF